MEASGALGPIKHCQWEECIIVPRIPGYDPRKPEFKELECPNCGLVKCEVKRSIDPPAKWYECTQCGEEIPSKPA